MSTATNLVSGDNNGYTDVFVHDRVTGTTERVSVDSAENEADYSSGSPSLSADAQRIAFVTSATNLVSGDTNDFSDVFVRDRLAGTTIRVNVPTGGGQANNSSNAAFISANGRFVAFTSNADNLVSGDTNNEQDVFVHDLDTGETTRVSVASDGSQVTGGSSQEPVLSADGSWVAFSSTATDVVPLDYNGASDIFVRRWR